MKIGIHIEPHVGYSYDDITKLAQAADEAGFYRFTVSDHFFGYPKGTENQCYEAWTTIALLVPQTENILLGTQVTSQSYRNPALLAKIVANLDNASNGRIDLGIGAGWKEAEYDAYGYEYPSAKTRILQLRETLQILKLLWTEDRPSFEGDFYKIKDVRFLPKPVQQPHVPIWVGTETLEAPMMEETAARYGDGLDFVKATPEKYVRKKERMKNMCEKVGRDFDDMKWSVGTMAVVLGEDEDDYRNRIQAVLDEEWMEKTIPDEMKSKWIDTTIEKHKQLGGPPEDVLERLTAYKGIVDIVNICLPIVGNIRKNGLDTIRILKELVVPKI
ncbi:MAG: 5,10-methylenetetrahydromethanopterin reductase [Candidatus Thorarchaeota archaeon]|nr:MAG: 5,10-methylenetetrahydromethanopterin reductase [Candidatus Thorarchaeota archaeon]